MTTIKNSSSDTSMQLTIADDGASLSVSFPFIKFPKLLGWEAYTDSPSETTWRVVTPDPDRPTFTERGDGQYAPYKRAHVRDISEDEDTLKVWFDAGVPYSKTLKVRT